jgi:TPR repeat protein
MVYILGLLATFIFLMWFGWAWWRNILERKSPEQLFVLANKAMLSGREDLGAQAFRRAAERGHGLSQVQIGMMYYHGKLYEQNRALAAEWLEKAASQGIPNAQHNLGVMFLKGEGVPVDHQQAREWLGRAAAQGVTQAIERLATLNTPKSDSDAADPQAHVTPDLPDALLMDYRMERHLKIFKLIDDPEDSEDVVFERVREHVRTGDSNTQALCGVLMFNRSKSGTNQQAARKLLGQAANSGHAHARYLLTRIWPEPGQSTNGAATVWDEAKQGNMRAQYELGGRYRRGEGFEPAISLSTQWYQKAAAQGHPQATYCIAMAYLHGWGAERDPAKAAAGFRWCAERGDRDAAHWMYLLFQYGEVDVREDRGEAARWLFRAAELGDPAAQYDYGLSLTGVDDAPRPQAMGWWEKAAGQGHASAIQLIAEMRPATPSVS